MSHHRTACEGCGCNCRDCSDPVSSLHLHVEIENLKQRLLEKENHIVSMETNFLREAEKFPNGEMAAMTDELLTWQEKYSRLYEAHKRVQKVNQNLEDKLLRIVDKCETEKNILTAEVATLTRRLVDEKFNVNKLQEENERYRNDVNLAIQLLQCKPANFVPQKYDSLPIDLQQKVRNYVSSKRRISISDTQQKQPEMKTIKVPIPTFPPTAMVYSVNKSSDEKDGPSTGNGSEEKNSRHGTMDIVSAAIMAKVLEEREKERSRMKHCDTCTCSVNSVNDHTNTNNNNISRHHNKETQTVNSFNNLFTNEPNICTSSNCNNSSYSGNSNCSNSLNTSNISNIYQRNDSCGKNSRLGCNNHSSSSNSNNNSISSPMNIRRNKIQMSTVPVSINNIPTGSSMMSTTSDLTVANKADLTQIDYFSDFNMMPALDDPDNCSFVSNSNCKNDKNLSDNNYNRGCNKLLFLNDITAAASVRNNDLLSDDIPVKNNNGKMILGNSNKHNNVEEDDESNNLIVFNKQSPVLTKSLLNNTMPVIAVTSSTVNMTTSAPSSTLTVLGSNLNIGSTGVGNRTGSARHCSVRLQAGTSNILLDNVVDGPYAPVLYKSRQQPAPDPLLVHVPPSRSLSASSSVSSCCIDDQRNPIDVINNVNNALHSMSFSSSSSTSSTSSSASSTSSSSLATSSHKNLLLAQIRTETEI